MSERGAIHGTRPNNPLIPLACPGLDDKFPHNQEARAVSRTAEAAGDLPQRQGHTVEAAWFLCNRTGIALS